jgi:hypothetical protein
MKVYIYAADIYCKACGKDIRKQITDEGFAPADPKDECSYDSDEFPKGPIRHGGGSSDSPQHCGSGPKCLEPTEIDGEKYGRFLKNPLTLEGVKCLKERLQEDGDSPVVKFWVEFYRSKGYNLPEPEKD